MFLTWKDVGIVIKTCSGKTVSTCSGETVSTCRNITHNFLRLSDISLRLLGVYIEPGDVPKAHQKLRVFL
jgi:hypothetical protein